MALRAGPGAACLCFRFEGLDPSAGRTMTEPVVLARFERDGGSIETLQCDGMEIYYRSCVGGICRYSSDLFQAELYLEQLLSR